MRLIHTSDWHLGRSFHQVGLLGAQGAFLDHLVEVVESESVDAVLVSGDVYDRALPAPDTVRLLSETLERLTAAGAEVVLSSGNHDSAIRLGFASALLERAGLHVRTSIDSIGRPVLLRGRDGSGGGSAGAPAEVAVHALPYLEPSVAAAPLEVGERTHAGVLRAAMERVGAAGRVIPARHTVVMAHAFVTGATCSDSERDISVGGVSAVPAEVFAAADYVALGHLHGAQQLSETVRYSGSPVAMSFSEWRHRKGSWLLNLSGDATEVSFVPAPVSRPLAVLRGDLEDLLRETRYAEAERSWCQVTLTDPIRPLDAMGRVRARFPHTLDLRFEPRGAVHRISAYATRGRDRSDLDVCCDFLAHVRSGSAATDAEQALLGEAIEGARLWRAEHDGEGTEAGAAEGTAPGAAEGTVGTAGAA